MEIKFVPTLEQGISDILQRIVNKLNNSGKLISKSLADTTKSHFTMRFPGSNHYAPNKVQQLASYGNIGKIDVDVPGVSRAIHDITIVPKFRNHLTIPMTSAAKGKSANDFNDLVYIRKKNGNEFLARNNGSNLTFMYFLAKQVHQKQDRSILPTEKTYVDNLLNKISHGLKS